MVLGGCRLFFLLVTTVNLIYCTFVNGNEACGIYLHVKLLTNLLIASLWITLIGTVNKILHGYLEVLIRLWAKVIESKPFVVEEELQLGVY